MIKVNNVSKNYRTFRLQNISFDLPKGYIMGVIGRNGAGKTTTIRILMDVFHANSGEMLLDGKPFNPAKTKIGYHPEERGLYPKRKVIEQMVYLAMLRNVPKKKATANAKKWMQRMQVAQYENSLLETLSKGNQQKVQLASILFCDP